MCSPQRVHAWSCGLPPTFPELASRVQGWGLAPVSQFLFAQGKCWLMASLPDQGRRQTDSGRSSWIRVGWKYSAWQSSRTSKKGNFDIDFEII